MAYRNCIRVGIIKAKVVHKEGTRVHYRSATPCNQSYPCRMVFYEKGYSIAQCGKYNIRLSTDFRSDMMWWKEFASSWNGCSAYTLPGGIDFTVTSDASGSWRCGAWHQTKWFKLSWDNRSQSMHIFSAKEVIPVLVSAAVWGKEWKGKRVM